MLPHLPAAILILVERDHPDKQQAIALAAAASSAATYAVTTFCHDWQDCLALVLTGHIRAVICAIDPGPVARETLEKAGAKVVVARESVASIHRGITKLVTKLYSRGWDTGEIADFLEVRTKDVRESLDRSGIRRRNSEE